MGTIPVGLRTEEMVQQKIFVVNSHHKFIARQKQINFIFSPIYLAQLINIIFVARIYFVH